MGHGSACSRLIDVKSADGFLRIFGTARSARRGHLRRHALHRLPRISLHRPRGTRDRTDGTAVARSADDIRLRNGWPRNRRRTAYGCAQRRFARVPSGDASTSRRPQPVAAAGPPQLAADGARCIARTDAVAAGSGDAGGRIVGRRSGRMPIRAQDFTHINIGAAHMACNISIGFGQAAFDRLLGACSNMFPDREQINELSPRTPTQWVEGSACGR